MPRQGRPRQIKGPGRKTRQKSATTRKEHSIYMFGEQSQAALDVDV